MTRDIFGNLRDWGPVLDQLTELRSKRILDNHQEGLVRILRYRDNWRLRETALEYARDLATPSDDLLRQILAIVVDHDTYYEMRIMAVQTLAILCSRMMRGHRTDQVAAKGILSKLAALLESAGPPVFHAAVATAVEEMEPDAIEVKA